MRVEVIELGLGSVRLGCVRRSGKKPESLRRGDALVRPEGDGEVVGYVTEAKATALPQFYWLYEITCELLDTALVSLGEELEIERELNVLATAPGHGAEARHASA